MAALLTQVKARLTIYAHRRTRRLLDGEYASVFHGHSLDFDDLRGYVPGDEIRDIDWKATARHSSPLVKRYVAHRRHSLGLVVDTGKEFDALSAGGENKRELAILVAGMAGYLAVRHGDDVMLISGDANGTQATDSKGSEAHLESMLRIIQRSAATAGPSDLHRQLSWLADHIRKRMMLFIITDDAPLRPETEPVLRRLMAQHEILWLSISDAVLTAPALNSPADVLDAQRTIPDALRLDPGLHAEFLAHEQQLRDTKMQLLKRIGIAEVGLSRSDEALPALRRVMERHRYGSR